MIGTLFKKNILSGIKVIISIFAILCLYTTVIIYMYNPELSDMLSGYQEALPEMMSAVGMTGIAANLLEWIQIYLYGFLMHIFPMIFAIIICNKLVMSYIDRGSMASLLSTPHSRGKIIVTQAVSAILMMVVLMTAVTILGIVSSQVMFPNELDVVRYLQLNASATLLQLIVLGIAFLTACIVDEAKQYYTFGAGIPILFFLLLMISNLGGDMEKVKYFTIYTLFPAENIVQGKEGCLVPNLVMAGMVLVLFGGGIWWFKRRDLSV